jgi:hypothetical protein
MFWKDIKDRLMLNGLIPQLTILALETNSCMPSSLNISMLQQVRA